MTKHYSFSQHFARLCLVNTDHSLWLSFVLHHLYCFELILNSNHNFSVKSLNALKNKFNSTFTMKVNIFSFWHFKIKNRNLISKLVSFGHSKLFWSILMHCFASNQLKLIKDNLFFWGHLPLYWFCQIIYCFVFFLLQAR